MFPDERVGGELAVERSPENIQLMVEMGSVGEGNDQGSTWPPAAFPSAAGVERST